LLRPGVEVLASSFESSARQRERHHQPGRPGRGQFGGRAL